MKPRLRHLLEELSELLRDVISESPSAIEKVDQIQEEGYTIHLLLDCKPSDEVDDEYESEDPVEEAAPGELPVPEQKALPPAAATFRINADDLRFLRSVGIDPTRRARKKRSSSQSEASD